MSRHVPFAFDMEPLVESRTLFVNTYIFHHAVQLLSSKIRGLLRYYGVDRKLQL